ncbi:RING-H2 finger protein ATL46 [Hibiscus syriacus]|uniref:RING-type E3 ubiquitin transferase n=1 Tax=Hibiscus syriacus TaxID=106335 RepID=A0A6A3CLF0_HIBSY|nr:RING-H2 finger protein ATL47-like [Hibiscus syriacus]KAE8730255.1 RING-H2 finger protein ATL46 [Hibiscus syriacus]
MCSLACPSPKMSWVQSETKLKAVVLNYYHAHSLLSSSSFSSPPLPFSNDYQKQPDPLPSSSSASKISPAVLFIIVVLAVIFFISGLLHLLVRFLMKHRSPSSLSESERYPEMSGTDAYQRQLQQLFHLHDSGLDQSFIDALPVFLYKEIMGLKEPFDCAVCLCEFLEEDRLRLLPLCSHAFHIDCIDTWLMSNSTCPLCRGTIFTPELPIENPVFDFEYPREETMLSSNGGSGVSLGTKPAENDIGKRVFSVRLGKFRSSNEGKGREVEEGETSSSNLDARRCYSMGSFQYVVADELQVTLCRPSRGSNDTASSMKLVKGRGGNNGNSSNYGDFEGKKINLTSKGESFSVSKIWQWSKKGKFPSSSDTIGSSSSISVGLPCTDTRTQVT